MDADKKTDDYSIVVIRFVIKFNSLVNSSMNR